MLRFLYSSVVFIITVFVCYNDFSFPFTFFEPAASHHLWVCLFAGTEQPVWAGSPGFLQNSLFWIKNQGLCATGEHNTKKRTHLRLVRKGRGLLANHGGSDWLKCSQHPAPHAHIHNLIGLPDKELCYDSMPSLSFSLQRLHKLFWKLFEKMRLLTLFFFLAHYSWRVESVKLIKTGKKMENDIIILPILYP